MTGTTSSPPRDSQRPVRAEIVLNVHHQQHPVLGRSGRAVDTAGDANLRNGRRGCGRQDARGHVLLGVSERPLGCPQSVKQLAVSLEPLVRSLGQHPGDEVLDLRGDMAGERGRVRLLDLLHDVVDRFSPERDLAGQHLVQGGAEREDVGAVIDPSGVEKLLGGHVAGCSHGRAQRGMDRGSIRASDFGQPEVGELYLPAAVEQDVGRLDVPVDHVDLLERFRESLRDHLDDLKGASDGNRGPLAQVRLQCLALDVLHDDVVVSLGHPAVKNADDPWRMETGCEAGLAEEAFGDTRLLCQVGVEELHCHIEVEVPVSALIDDTHTPFAEP